MKGFLIGVMLLTGTQLFANKRDTTVTSFEIHLKRKSADNSIAFNTTSIDRLKLYNTVMLKIKNQISAEAFCSLHQPMVLLKFNEYTSEKGRADEISFGEQRSLKTHKYNYFVKVSGYLNKSNFTMRVCVFDARGRLIAKGRSKATGKSMEDLQVDPSDTGLTEQAFLELVTSAASSIHLSI
jgi:hypothetical protein